MKQKRKELTKDEINLFSNKCLNKLFSLEEYKKATTILTYISYNNELKTDDLINQAFLDRKKVASPKVIGKNMEFYYFNSLDELQKGKYGILEPRQNNIKIEENSILIMPALAFDIKGHRVGYGGGFYDRFLERYNYKKIGLCYDFQIVDDIEYEEFDIKPNIIITDSRIFRIE